MTGILVPTADEAAWLHARRQGVTASEIAVIMGLSPYGSPYELYHRKLGNLPPLADNPAMERGRVLEPVVADMFAGRRYGYWMSGDGRTLYRSGRYGWQLATPDRLLSEIEEADGETQVAGYAAVLECKVTGAWDGWGDDGTDEIPVHYRCQVLWQCDVLGLGEWWLAALHPGRWELRVYHGTVDDQAEADLSMMRTLAREFLGRLHDGDEPDVDWRPATGAALRARYSELEDTDALVGARTAISYRAAVRRYEQAKRRKDEMTNRVLAAMGDARRAKTPDGDLVATRTVSTTSRISTSKLRENHPDIAAECTTQSTTVRLTPAKEHK